jgi:hypothetical protein
MPCWWVLYFTVGEWAAFFKAVEEPYVNVVETLQYAGLI